MADLVYQDPFAQSEDTTTPYRLLSRDHVSMTTFDGREMLKVDPENNYAKVELAATRAEAAAANLN